MRQWGQEDATGRTVGANGEGRAEDNIVWMCMERKVERSILQASQETEAVGWRST